MAEHRQEKHGAGPRAPRIMQRAIRALICLTCAYGDRGHGQISLGCSPLTMSSRWAGRALMWTIYAGCSDASESPPHSGVVSPLSPQHFSASTPQDYSFKANTPRGFGRGDFYGAFARKEKSRHGP